MTIMSWTDARVEALKKLWEAGLSASQIAAELGYVTRNGVIGKVHRLGLSGRAKNPTSAKPRARRLVDHMVYVERRPSRVATALAQVVAVEPVSAPLAYENVVPLHQRVSLMELNEATCHWPIGDPGTADFFFCGGKALNGMPYCAHHSRVAYRAVGDR
ncbi:MAG: GcrA family cell cycle regulator [Afipia sp.]